MPKCYYRDYGLTFRYVNALHHSGARSLNSPATIVLDRFIALLLFERIVHSFNESSRFEAAW